MSRKRRECEGNCLGDNGIAAHKRFNMALGIQFMQQMTGGLSVHTNPKFSIPNFCRYKYCNILHSRSIPNQLGDESGKMSVPWLFPAAFLSYYFFFEGMSSFEGFVVLLKI